MNGAHIRLPAAMLSLFPLLACGHTMTATVEGLQHPKTVSCKPGETIEIENGDFRIEERCASEKNRIVGDGKLERVSWDFPIEVSFREAVRKDCIIRSASVELEVQPTADPFDESLAVRDWWEFGLEEVRSLDPDASRQTVTLDMLDRPGGISPYTPETLRELILGASPDGIPIEYGDDALISYAKLELSCK